MDRKKFVTLFSISIIGTAVLKANPFKYFISKNSTAKNKPVEIKINSNAVKREKSGKKNG